MVDPLEPDDGDPALPPGPRRSTYTPPPAGAEYRPGSLTGDAVPLPAEPPTVGAVSTEPPPSAIVVPPVAPAAEPERVLWQVQGSDSVPEPVATSSSSPAGIRGQTAPVSAIDLAEIPPPPSRLSLSDAELASVVDPASAAPGSTAELIDLFEEQLTLRAEEAQRLSLWEQAVRETGLPQADEIVQSVRSAFTGLIDVIPAAASTDDPWARYPGEIAPPAPSADDHEPLVIPPISAPESEPEPAPEPPSGDAPALELAPPPRTEPEAPASLAGVLADAPPPFGLVPSAVVPPPADDAAFARTPEPPELEQSAETEQPPALIEPSVEPPEEEPAPRAARPMPSAPIGAPTGPILTSPAAVA
ncbi:MAG: hypothetical protein Q7T15_02260, partial [Microcella sp.]|nr:hypothetical protein [Microcella sp.]